MPLLWLAPRKEARRRGTSMPRVRWASRHQHATRELGVEAPTWTGNPAYVQRGPRTKWPQQTALGTSRMSMSGPPPVGG